MESSDGILAKKAKLEEFTLLSWDFKKEDNGVKHHTDEYEHTELIVRRGQNFSISFTFNRKINFSVDKVVLKFRYGNNPKENKGTDVKIPIDYKIKEEVKHASWRSSATIRESTLDIQIISSNEALVGVYTPFLEVSNIHSDESVQVHRLDKMYILFNPWNEVDEVYQQDDDEREEYIMNEVGYIWQGTYLSSHPTPWNYGQFDDVCLNAALHLMDKYGLKDYSRGNPVLITRCISAMVNSNDDDGIITGKWDDPYPKGCTLPWAWTGSIAILEQYMKNKEPVEFGQCWVFSGVVTSLLRALGIPTRSVSNFESLHDNDGSLTCDIHWDENDDPIEELNDSVWNYHVWNESYFKRNDLPLGYDGWQAHDATPQETSGGRMRCGPASLKAIKEGHVYLPNDTPFIFAEVNGDKCHWTVKKDKSMECIYIEKQAVGKIIKTKMVGSLGMEDITHLYKYPERSDEERDSIRRAFAYGSRRQFNIYENIEPDVIFSVEAPDQSGINIGENIKIFLNMKNKDALLPHHVKYRVSLLMTYYTGVSADRIKFVTGEKQLSPQEDSSILVLDISPDEYRPYIKQDASFKIYVHGRVIENNRHFAHQENFILTKPSLSLQIPDDIKKDEPFDLTISFYNPFSDELTNAEFHIEAAGMVKSLVLPAQNTGGLQLVTATTTLHAKKKGRRTIVAHFSSDQLSGLAGTANFNVRISYAGMY